MTSIESIKGIVYSIKCNINDKYYVGQTLSHNYNEKNKAWESYGINSRILKHLYKVQQNVDYPLYNDIHKYGIHNFTISIENEIESKDISNLDRIEMETIDKYNSVDNGYNISSNTSYLCVNKKLILKYYNKNVERSEEYNKRNQRRKQITLPQKDRYSFFEDKEISNIKINPIREGGVLKTARVLIDIKQHDIYRINFTYKDISASYEKALEYCNKIYNGELDVHPSLLELKNNKDIEKYEYARRLEECKTKKITKINGKDYYHKTHDKDVYFLSIYFEDSSKKRFMFGGKNITINDAYNTAKDFIQRLNISNDICSLLSPTGGC